jgi:hypothetical protein
MSDRQGIEIDYCPKCRGIWLDRGELDKIIERSGQSTASAPTPVERREPPREYREEYRERSDDRRDYDDDRYKQKKRRSFLDDIFDF